MVLSPITPSSDPHHPLSSSSSPQLEGIFSESPALYRPPTDYVLQNNGFEVNDGTERSISWQNYDTEYVWKYSTNFLPINSFNVTDVV